MAEDWQEVGAAAVASDTSGNTNIGIVAASDPKNDAKYMALLSKLQTWHGELLRLDLAENPAEIGKYLGNMRLHVNMLFRYINLYTDELTAKQKEYAEKRQHLYEVTLQLPKKTPSAAETHAREMSRSEEAEIKVIENRIQQIKNEYERYNGICMYLQSRMREFNTERIMG